MARAEAIPLDAANARVHHIGRVEFVLRGVHVRSVIGFAMLVAAGLGGIEYLTKNMPAIAPGGALQLQAALTESPSSPAPAPQSAPWPAAPPPSFGGVIQTVAANDTPSLPPVSVAPQAPRAAPIDPIVTPLNRAAPKTNGAKTAATGKPAYHVKPAASHPTGPAAKTKSAKFHDPKPVKTTKAAKPASNTSGVNVIRPGFKLTCTAAQKLDPGKQRCVPLKTASAKKAKG